MRFVEENLLKVFWVNADLTDLHDVYSKVRARLKLSGVEKIREHNRLAVKKFHFDNVTPSVIGEFVRLLGIN